MLNKAISILVVNRIILCALCGLLGQPLGAARLSAQTWDLPQGMTVKDSGPRTYRFTVDYNSANTKGEIVYSQPIVGEYTRGLAGGEVEWKNVTHVISKHAWRASGSRGRTIM